MQKTKTTERSLSFLTGEQARNCETDISDLVKLLIMNSFGTRVAGTVIVGIGWLAFVLLFLAFYAGRLDLFQNLTVLAVSVIVAIGIVVVMWIKWALG